MRKRNILFIIGILLLLSGCSKSVSTEDIQIYLQGELDSMYKGVTSTEYQKATDRTEQQIKEIYEAKIEKETEYFIRMMNGTDTEDIKQDIRQLIHQFYQKAIYKIEEIKEYEDGYVATVTLSVSDAILNFIKEEKENYLIQYNSEINKKADSLTEEEKNILWLSGIVEGIQEKLIEDSTYTQQHTIHMEYRDKQYQIRTVDFTLFDHYMPLYREQ